MSSGISKNFGTKTLVEELQKRTDWKPCKMLKYSQFWFEKWLIEEVEYIEIGEITYYRKLE